MRRIIITLTALAVLSVAATALAAAQFNTYTASTSFSPNKAGSAKSPAPIGMSQVLTAHGTNGNRAAPLVDLRSTIYGMINDGKDFPTCSFDTVKAASNDASCPSGALVATADVMSELGPSANPKEGAPGQLNCNPGLRVWNSGHGNLTFFFWSTTAPGSAHYCGGVPTGSTPPYKGTIKQSGKNLIIDVPLPSYVSNRVLNSPTWGSLVSEKITWKKLTKKVHGKTKAFFASVGCNKGKRNWTQLFTADFTNAADTGGTMQSVTKKGSVKCTK